MQGLTEMEMTVAQLEAAYARMNERYLAAVRLGSAGAPMIGQTLSRIGEVLAKARACPFVDLAEDSTRLGEHRQLPPPWRARIVGRPPAMLVVRER